MYYTSNLNLTALHKAQFLNKLIVTQLTLPAKGYPLPKKHLNDMRSACSKFIWRNRLRRLALEHSYPKFTKEGPVL